ncbi:GNAT family N-acetyltransferase [Pseudoalteromonas 'SMAR']|uniref:GNAT family N-acetyltransferase n=1 Tax=Pseudoalteromonas 'SMAR' TaxID=3416908 RepID=UPI003AF292D5
MQLTTSRLVLRPLQRSDWPLWQQLHQDPAVMAYIGDIPDEKTLGEKFHTRILSPQQPWHKEASQWLTFTIIEQASGKAIGFHGFLSHWSPYQQAELGFMLDPAFQGQGYAFEASRAVIDFAFAHCHYHKLVATVTQGNAPSHGLLKKLGFELEGVLKHNFRIAEQWVNDEKFALFNNE